MTPINATILSPGELFVGMERRYADWIAANVGDPRGKCAEVTLQMQATFPELLRVRGFYQCVIGGRSAHWWLKTADGKIVDPTAAQFAPHGDYEEWDESRKEPTGKCINCGGMVFDNSACCSTKCGREMEQACSSPRPASQC